MKNENAIRYELMSGKVLNVDHCMAIEDAVNFICMEEKEQIKDNDGGIKYKTHDPVNRVVKVVWDGVR